MDIHVQNETAELKMVVLGQPESLGSTPDLSESFDAKSYRSIKKGVYPTEKDVTTEMNDFEGILKKHHVQVLRPKIIKDYNQVFARDVAFAISDHLFISNIIQDRALEQDAYREIFNEVSWRKIVNLPSNVQVEGGDVMLWNDYLFVGTCYSEDYRNFKTARTNKAAVQILKEYFPEKRVIDLDLKKNDRYPERGILHLDCTLNLVGKDKCLVYPAGFVRPEDFHLIQTLFGKENCFVVTKEEVVNLTTNIFSISEDVVVTDTSFIRLNKQLHQWGIQTEEINYREISKMGGLLRCSTMPLFRND